MLYVKLWSRYGFRRIFEIRNRTSWYVLGTCCL